MILASILSSVFLFNILASSNNFQSSYIHKRKQEINTHLEKVYDHLRSDNHKEACKEASKAVKLIETNLSNLKKIEPYQNWSEIKETLIEIPINLCKKSQKQNRDS